MPTVSVVIPVYNGERFIGDAIQSVLNETFRDFEIIVVDDGSTDGTEKIVHQFPGPISYHRQENQGAGVARNVGVSFAQGEWIAFLDADDAWYPDKLKVQFEFAETYPEVAFFYSDMDAVDEKGGLTRRGFLKARLQRRREKRRQNIVSLIFHGQPPPYPSTVLIRKKDFLTAGGFSSLFRGNYHEDLELFARIAHLFPIHFIPESLVQYRVRKTRSSMDASNWDENWPILLDALWGMWQKEPEKQAMLLGYYAKYFSERGRHRLRGGDYREARMYFRLACLYQPFYWINYRRWMASFLPGVRRLYFLLKGRVSINK